MLQNKGNAKDLWDTLTDEMMKKPKMVVTSLQCQLRNMKFSEDNDLREHLDKSRTYMLEYWRWELGFPTWSSWISYYLPCRLPMKLLEPVLGPNTDHLDTGHLETP
jgi:hypothetical protein